MSDTVKKKSYSNKSVGNGYGSSGSGNNVADMSNDIMQIKLYIDDVLKNYFPSPTLLNGGTTATAKSVMNTSSNHSQQNNNYQPSASLQHDDSLNLGNRKLAELSIINPKKLEISHVGSIVYIKIILVLKNC